MPTITQLSPASAVSSSDLIPISQGGSLNAASIGELLLSAQPVITLQSPSLLGRTSLGPGGPEEINVGIGMKLSAGMISANGADHATFPVTPTLSPESDLVISDQGSPMLMPAELLRGLFSAGQNVSIDSNGVISATAGGSASTTSSFGSAIGSLRSLSSVAAQDLLPVSHAGTDYAVTCATLLNGITIDQAPAAEPSADSDTMWIAQSTNVMSCQTLGAIWVWIEKKFPSYKQQVVEVTTSINLDTTVHNGRILVCSQPVTLTPLPVNMGSGFRCQVINLSPGNVTLGAGFLTSTGSLVLGPRQALTILCLTYSAGTVSYAEMPQASVVAATTPPGQVTGLTASSIGSTTITITWQPPTSGGSPFSYTIQYANSGTTNWATGPTQTSGTTYQLSGLLPGNSYDIKVAASNQGGTGTPSQVLTVSTTAAVQGSPPGQVTGLTATALSGSSVGLSWSSQSGANAAANYTVQYRTTGSTAWASSVPGITATSATVANLQPATSYDFSVFGVNPAGSGTTSSVISATTEAAGNSVSSITWNLGPSGTYTSGSGTIGVNAHVSPSNAPVQFGFSTSSTNPATTWTAGLHVNSDLWGAYAPTPATAGTWYAWVEGIDGSSPTVFPAQFLVQ